MSDMEQARRNRTDAMISLPDFIIIGAQKSGTSSLFSYFNQHPEIMLPREKELHFFDYNYSNGIQWYKSQFPIFPPQSNYITGEASPYYFYHPLAAKRIFDHLPWVKLIVLLRDPADRAYSHYQMLRMKEVEPLLCFEDAIIQEEERLAGENEKLINDPTYYSFNHQSFSYLNRGLYYKQLNQWLTLFKPEQFLVIRSEDFFSNPETELLRVYQYLDVRIKFPDDYTPVNRGAYKPMKHCTRVMLDDFFSEDQKALDGLLKKII
ncbi:MAG: sulfotransferase domain-containing protein [bacterium]